MKRKATIVPASLKTIDVKALLRSRGVYMERNYNQAAKEAALPLARELYKSTSKPKIKEIEKPRHAQFTNEVVMAYWEKQIHIVEVIEAKFDNKVRQFVQKIAQGFLKNFEKEVDNQKTFAKFLKKDYFSDSEDDWQVEAQLDFTPLLMDQAVLAGQEAYKLIGTDDVYLPDTFRKKVESNVSKFTASMLQTDKDHLINIITHGLESGKSVPEIRNQIETDFAGEYSKMQAQRITRTEVLRVSNQASLDAYEQSGVVEGKQWLTAGAVDECAQYEGQIVTLSDSFYGSDSEFADGDPPLHPNCRCVILPVVVNEKAYQPEINLELFERIKELEDQIDKRTKEYREVKDLRVDDEAYIKSLENLLGVDNE